MWFYLEVSGYDGYGSAKVKIDKEKFKEDYSDILNDEDNKYQSFLVDAETFFWDLCVSGALDNKSELRNGDTITYHWECEESVVLEQFGCKLKCEDKVFTVEGLKEIENFDPFTDVDVHFSGVSPDGEATLELKGGVREDVEYKVYPNSNLCNGDVVTVSLDGSDSHAKDDIYWVETYGFRPTEIKKQFTVENLGTYDVYMKDVTSENLEEMKTKAEAVLKINIKNHWSDAIKLESMEYLGMYFLRANNFRHKDMKNAALLVYKVNADIVSGTGAIKENVEYYYVTSFYNLYKETDGTCVVDVSDFDSQQESFEKEYVYDEESSFSDYIAFDGYLTLEELVNSKVIVWYSSNYHYETDIK